MSELRGAVAWSYPQSNMSAPDIAQADENTPHILAFGAYDTRKPRVRLLLRAIRDAGALHAAIHVRAWESVPQTNIPSRWSLVKVAARMAVGYPAALWRLVREGRRLARQRPGSALLLPYPGIMEILLIAPIAKALGLKVILDAFLPIYDTVVGDRSLVGPGLMAKTIWLMERAMLRLADIIVVDTDSHGAYFADEFGIPVDRIETVLVGAEPLFSPAAKLLPVEDILGPDDGRPIVLFYGQLIPLHGVPTIIEAARLSDDSARWIIIGRGQLQPLVEGRVREGGEALARKLTWIPWVDYEKLPSVIARADLCLGVFGASDKSARVIPNKLFQQAAMGKPVLTRSSPAVDPLARAFPQAILTVPADDPQALADAVAGWIEGRSDVDQMPSVAVSGLSPSAGVAHVLDRLAQRE
ncbi:MAG: glycosyltransferase [Pseudomonadota bacterium]